MGSTLTVTAGVQSSGTLQDTHSDNGVELVIDEVAGTPGYAIDFNFGDYEDVPTTALKANFYAWYEGNAGHNVKLQQWNYNTTTWVNVTAAAQDFPEDVSEQQYQFTLIDDPNYIQSNEIQLRVVHNSPGNINHKFHIDYLYLELAGKAEVEFRGMYRGIMRKMR